MNLSVDKARELFDDAVRFEAGDWFLPPAHQLRILAVDTFGHASAVLVNKVCCEIFRIVAQDALRNEADAKKLLNALANEMNWAQSNLSAETIRLLNELPARLK